MYPILETERIILRPFTNDDSEKVFKLISAFKQQNKGEHFKDIRTLDNAKRINDETIKAGNEWAIIHKETKEPIGYKADRVLYGEVILSTVARGTVDMPS